MTRPRLTRIGGHAAPNNVRRRAALDAQTCATAKLQKDHAAPILAVARLVLRRPSWVERRRRAPRLAVILNVAASINPAAKISPTTWPGRVENAVAHQQTPRQPLASGPTPSTRARGPRYPAGVKRSVQVEIAGQQLTIRSDEGADYVHQLAEYVDAHLRVLSGGRRITNSAGVQRVALLVAMQLADELFREKDLHQRFRRRVGDRLETLRRALDDHEQRLATLHEQPQPGPTP